MTRGEFDAFLLAFAGLCAVLCAANLLTRKKSGPKAVRLALACLATAAASLAFRADQRVLCYAFGAVAVGALLFDVVRRPREKKR